jgi:hypothetical protein
VTWHHVAALLIAAAMVMACGISEKCNGSSFNGVLQLATVIVAGAFGHAGAGMRTKRAEQHETQGDGK